MTWRERLHPGQRCAYEKRLARYGAVPAIDRNPIARDDLLEWGRTLRRGGDPLADARAALARHLSLPAPPQLYCVLCGASIMAPGLPPCVTESGWHLNHVAAREAEA